MTITTIGKHKISLIPKKTPRAEENGINVLAAGRALETKILENFLVSKNLVQSWLVSQYVPLHCKETWRAQWCIKSTK
jgi:hypothetical protein